MVFSCEMEKNNQNEIQNTLGTSNSILENEHDPSLIKIHSSNPELYEALKANNINSYQDMIKTTVLDLSDKKLKTIQGLEIFNNLVELDLSDNQLKEIKELKKLFFLEKLDLNNNQIKFIYDISDLTKIRYLNINNTKAYTKDNVKQLELDETSNLKIIGLKYLNISNNPISNIQDIIHKREDRSLIDFIYDESSFKKIISLSNSNYTLFKYLIKSIYSRSGNNSYNKKSVLTYSVDETIQNTSRNNKIDDDFIKLITNIRFNAQNLEKEERVGFSFEGISILSNLTSFSLDGVSSEEVRDFISNLNQADQIESISIHPKTELRPIYDFTFLDKFNKNLRSLKLDHYNLKELDFIKKFKSLENLSLSDNDIKNISALQDLNLLRNIDLTNNNIDDISPLKNLANLEKINLSGNIDIEKIPKLFCRLKLKSLNLDYCKIKDKTDLEFLSNLPSLSFLKLPYYDDVNYSILNNLINDDTRKEVAGLNKQRIINDLKKEKLRLDLNELDNKIEDRKNNRSPTERLKDRLPGSDYKNDQEKKKQISEELDKL